MKLKKAYHRCQRQKTDKKINFILAIAITEHTPDEKVRVPQWLALDCSREEWTNYSEVVYSWGGVCTQGKSQLTR